MEAVYNLQELQEKIATEKGILLYFSSESCSVCKVLRPKVKELIQAQFPLLHSYYIDIERSPMISGQFRIFTIPTILLFFDGKEQARYSRTISMHQLEDSISRPYTLLFEN